MSDDTWRDLAERANKEQDPERLMALVGALNGILRSAKQLPSSTESRKPDWTPAGTQSCRTTLSRELWTCSPPL